VLTSLRKIAEVDGGYLQSTISPIHGALAEKILKNY
jgi:hypothetical protein